MEVETFYGVTLSEKDPLAQFEIADPDKCERDQKILMDQKLIIKQIILGTAAKEGEFNVVQAETRVSDKENLKIPIAVLKVGETRVLRPNIEFPSSSVTFKLIQGTGPVYIHGQHVVYEGEVEEGHNMGNDDAYYEEEEEFEEDGPHPGNQTNGKSSHKKK